MHSVFKQYIHSSEDITEEVRSLWMKKLNAGAPSVVASLKDDDGNNPATNLQTPLARALILRGSRCVLARSLSKEWSGMKFQAVEIDDEANESYVDAPTCSVTELCDIDGHNEIVHLQHIPPIMIYGTTDRSVLLHLFYAKAPPPPGPLEEADVEMRRAAC